MILGGKSMENSMFLMDHLAQISAINTRYIWGNYIERT